MLKIVDYVLTTFSPTMFGVKASIHMKIVTKTEAQKLVNEGTAIVSTRISHENMANNLFPCENKSRFADMRPGRSAILLHYRGPPVDDDGAIPDGGEVTYYLVESEDYAEEE